MSTEENYLNIVSKKFLKDGKVSLKTLSTTDKELIEFEFPKENIKLSLSPRNLFSILENQMKSQTFIG
jgi:hypothetical protein